ncbi:helix-turn-helix transcriptional regulator (plasmid) [Photobacterium damselae subsp. damselae]|uniref:S24 family peptidase n=1 Tax=Photobacterium damselae TaxID=38293 RepID=UPI0010136A75|nr:S24 family peptidase [Photobacterium damselae]QAY37538.1 helix-turn-helix transcriptional regulator [Photobacterium damselae subsp. damselae]
MDTVGDRLRIQREKLKLSKKDLAKILKVTPMAITQWENNKTEPKGSNLRAVAELFEVSLDWLLLGKDEVVLIENESTCASIPFYKDVKASAGFGMAILEEEQSHISIDLNMIKGNNINNLVCIRIIGDSMEPVLLDGAIVVINTKDKHIRDGKIYVIRQDELLRVKSLSYIPSGIQFRSYNSEYKDESYTFQELSNFAIIGRVICTMSMR